MGGRGKVRVRPGQLGAGTAVQGRSNPEPRDLFLSLRAERCGDPWAVTNRPLGSWLASWARGERRSGRFAAAAELANPGPLCPRWPADSCAFFCFFFPFSLSLFSWNLGPLV